jgi:hypothetical protein
MDADAAAGGIGQPSGRLIESTNTCSKDDTSSDRISRKPGRASSGKMILPKMPRVPKVPSALPWTNEKDSQAEDKPPAAPPADAFLTPEAPSRKAKSRKKSRSGSNEKREEDLEQIDVQAAGGLSNGVEAWGLPKNLTDEDHWLLKQVWSSRLRTDTSTPITPRLFTAQEVAQAANILAKKWRHQNRMKRFGCFLASCAVIGSALFGLFYAAAVAGSPSTVDNTGILRKRSSGDPVKLGTVLEAAPLSDLWGMPPDQLRQLEAIVLREDRGRPGEMVMRVLHLHRSPNGETLLHFAQNETMIVGPAPIGVRMRWAPPVPEEVLDVPYVDSATSSHALFQVMAVADARL